MTERSADFELGVIGTSVDSTDPGSLTGFSDDAKNVDATLKYSGTHSYGRAAAEMIFSSTPGGCFGEWGGMSMTEVWGRIYLYHVAFPTGGYEIIRGFDNTAALKWRIGINFSGFISLRCSTTTLGAVAIAIGQWIRIEYHVIHSATVGQMEAKLYNYPNITTPSDVITTVATLDTGVDTVTFRIGAPSIGPASSTVYMDNIVLRDAGGYPGPATFAFPYKANFNRGYNGNVISVADDPSDKPWDSIDNAGGVFTYDNTHAYNELAVKVDHTAGGASAMFLNWDLPSPTDHYGRLYMYQPVLQGANTRTWVMGSTGITIAGLDGTTGKFGSMSNAIALNQWIRLEWHVVHHPTTGFIELKLFNNPDSPTPTEVLTSAPGDTGAAITSISFGVQSGGSSHAAPYWMDNIAVSLTGYLGAAEYITPSPAILQSRSAVRRLG